MNMDQELLVAEFLKPRNPPLGTSLYERTRIFLRNASAFSPDAGDFEKVIQLLDALYEYVKETKGGN